MKRFIRIFCDYGPILGFFVAYRFAGMMTATAVVMGLSVVAVALSYIVERKVPIMVLASAAILGIFGALTLISGDSSFIKMKPTMLYGIFGIALGFGVVRGRGWLSHVLGHTLKLPDEAWLTLSKRWALFFVTMAIINECVWRTLPEAVWVQFKVFGLLGLTMLFMLSQMPFMYKNQLNPK